MASLSWPEFRIRRRLLFEERIGVHTRRKVTAMSSEYAQSVARLKAAAAREEVKQQES